MRAIFYSLLSLATAVSARAIETADPKTPTDDGWDERQPDTVFNGQTVPPMIELNFTTLDKEIAKGNW